MATEHNTITDPNIHEPKGVSTATTGQVYVADGAASGAWTKNLPFGYTTATANQVLASNGAGDATWVNPYTLVPVVLSLEIPDITVGDTFYVPIPYAGTISKITTVLEGAIATADAVITAYDSAAASMGTITIAFSGSAAGDVDTLTPASNNVVTANDWIRLVVTAGATTSQRVWVNISLTRS